MLLAGFGLRQRRVMTLMVVDLPHSGSGESRAISGVWSAASAVQLCPIHIAIAGAAPFGRTRCLAMMASIALYNSAPFTASVAGSTVHTGRSGAFLVSLARSSAT